MLKNKDEEKKKLIKMSREEFDNYMCSKYPVLFQERNLPMSETCMCWGFDVGPGWYPLLDTMCDVLEYVRQTMGVETVVKQVKEKFGSLRFYYDNRQCSTTDGVEHCASTDAECFNKACNLIENFVSAYEEKSNRICEDCGECYYHPKITVGNWVYAKCEKCMQKAKPEWVKPDNVS